MSGLVSKGAPIGYWSSLREYPPLSYDLLVNVQRGLVAKKKAGVISTDVLLFLEHEPTFTVGRRGWPEYDSMARLLQTGAAIRKTDRGGLVTFHGPGQLVSYPVLDLRRWRADLRWYVNALQASAIDTTSRLGVTEPAALTDNVGVWLGQGQRKIAAIGFHVDRWIVSHGLSYNVSVDLEWFKHIVPCGLHDKSATSVQAEQPDLPARALQLTHVESILMGCMSRQFGRDIVPLQDIDGDLFKEIEMHIQSKHPVSSHPPDTGQ